MQAAVTRAFTGLGPCRRGVLGQADVAIQDGLTLLGNSSRLGLVGERHTGQRTIEPNYGLPTGGAAILKGGFRTQCAPWGSPTFSAITSREQVQPPVSQAAVRSRYSDGNNDAQDRALLGANKPTHVFRTTDPETAGQIGLDVEERKDDPHLWPGVSLTVSEPNRGMRRNIHD